MTRAKYRKFKLSRVAVLTVAIVLLYLVQGGTSSAHRVGSSVDGADAGLLAACWMKHVDGHAAGCFEIEESLELAFTRLMDSWRLAQSSHPGLEIRSVEYRDNKRISLLLAGEADEIAVAGPVSIGVETSSDGQYRIISVNESPSLPPLILVVSITVNVLYIVFGFAISKRLKRDPNSLRHEPSRWSNRQAFMAFYPIALLPALTLLLATLVTLSQDSSLLLWVAYKTRAGAGKTQAGFFAAYLALHAGCLLSYMLPYVEALRRGPKSAREAAPSRYTRKRIVINITLLGLIQAGGGFAMWGLAVFLARRAHVPVLVSAAISSLVGVAVGQRIFVYWVKRKSVRNLAEDHPAARAAVSAFERADAAIVRKSIAVLPRDHWPAPNAFVIGIGRKRCVVAVTEPLLENLSNEEVGAVLMHEYGHVKELHTSIMALSISLLGTWQLEFLIRGDEWLRRLGMSSETSIFLVRQIVLYGGLFGGLLILVTLISRWCERRADRFAQKLGSGAPLASALHKISVLSETPLQWPKWVRIVSTHPSFLERMNRLSNEPVAGPK